MVHHYLSQNSINLDDLQVLREMPKPKEIETIIKYVPIELRKIQPQKVSLSHLQVFRIPKPEPIKIAVQSNRVVDIEFIPPPKVKMTPVQVEREGNRYYQVIKGRVTPIENISTKAGHSGTMSTPNYVFDQNIEQIRAEGRMQEDPLVEQIK